jgi:hypothetical protein
MLQEAWNSVLAQPIPALESALEWSPQTTVFRAQVNPDRSWQLPCTTGCERMQA